VVIDTGEIDDDLVRPLHRCLDQLLCAPLAPVGPQARREGPALCRARPSPGGLDVTPEGKDGTVTRRLREIEEPFAVAPPSGARVRTRLHASDTDSSVLVAIGTHLGSLARGDLARRCREGRLDAKARATSRRVRKRSLTATSSSRWAGAITRTSEDSWQLAMRNLIAEHRSLHARISRIRRRLAVPVGGRRGRLGGYATSDERFRKQRRLQVLECRLAEEDRSGPPTKRDSVPLSV
jgi:hypothetical protein